jgi:hypothetical protein
MDRQLTSHHLEVMRRSLASGGLPPDQMAWILAEATRLLAERDQARSVIIELIGPMTDVRRLLNELHTLFVAEPLEPPGPASSGRRPRHGGNSVQVHRKL